jgi:hypothetical protein
MINELGRIWKEVVVAYSKVGLLSWYFPRGTEENQEYSGRECLSDDI